MRRLPHVIALKKGMAIHEEINVADHNDPKNDPHINKGTSWLQLV